MVRRWSSPGVHGNAGVPSTDDPTGPGNFRTCVGRGIRRSTSGGPTRMFAANTMVVTLLLIVLLIVLAVLLLRWLTARRPSQVARAVARTAPTESSAAGVSALAGADETSAELIDDARKVDGAELEGAAGEGAAGEGDAVEGDAVEGEGVADAAADEVAGESAAGESAAGDEVTGDEVTGDEVTGDEVTGDEVAGDEVAVDEVAVDEVEDRGEEAIGGGDRPSRRWALVRGEPTITASVQPPGDDAPAIAAGEADPAALIPDGVEAVDSEPALLTAGFAEGWHDDDGRQGGRVAMHDWADDGGFDALPEDGAHGETADGREAERAGGTGDHDGSGERTDDDRDGGDDDRLVARLDRAASLQAALEQARSRVQELEAERERNLEGLDQVAREYRRRGALVRTLRADVASSDDQTAAIASELAAMRDESSRLEEERMSLLRRAEAGQHLGAQLNAQLDEARVELDQAKAAAAELQALLHGSDERVRDLEASLSSSEADRRSIQSSLAGRDERVRRLEQSLAERDERLRSVETELAELSGRLIELGDRSAEV